MTKKKRNVVGRLVKLVAIRGLLHCRILKPVSLAPGVLVVVLLEVPRGVVVLLAGEDRLWKEGEDPVEAHHLEPVLLDGVETTLVRGKFLVDPVQSLVDVEQVAVRHGALRLDMSQCGLSLIHI